MNDTSATNTGPQIAADLAPIVAVTGANATMLDSIAESLAALSSRTAPLALDKNGVEQCCQAVLASFGGSLEHPPAIGTPASPSILASALAALFEPLSRIEDSRPVIASHLGLSLALPFLNELTRRPLLGIFVLSSPEQASGRNGASRSPIVELARYERYLRHGLSALLGVPTFVLDTNAETNTAHSGLASFLENHGVSDATDLARTIESAAVAERTSRGPERLTMLAEIDELYANALKAAGAHERLEVDLSERESEWSIEVLSLSADLDQVTGGLEWATRQIEPIMRASTPTVTKTTSTERDEPDDQSEPSEDGPYPLNAGEDRRAYHRWLSAHRQPTVIAGPLPKHVRATRPRRFGRRPPLISVLVPVWRTPLWALERCIASVLAQDFRDWQLCLCDDASGDEELTRYLQKIARSDKRITVTALEHNGGISNATNAALALAKGQFVAFLDHDDELTPDALSAIATAITANPDADVLYSDEDKIDAAGERFDPAFKPEWSPDLLLSFAYLCHLTVIRRDLVDELGGLRSAYDGSQDYDLSLRATERARQIVHVSKVLYHWRTLPGSAAADAPGAIAKPWAYEAGRRAIEDALARRDETGEVTADAVFPGRYHVRRALKSRPLVSIIIPFRDEPALLATCTRSLRADPGYDRIELVLVDNASELPETEALLERLDTEDNVRIVRYPGPFNWAAINNAAAKHATGEVLVFANNDIEARVSRWLDAMLGHALRDEVGAVGARLVYPDGAIQHAGVVIGLGGIAGHVLRGLPGDHPGYGSMAIQTRDCSVVTGACMMTRRDIFESVGGFDEQLPVAFNDVDYCLKLRKAGYLVVYTPLAELVHHESRSRGHTDDLMESKLILRRWADEIAAGDPYMNVHLSHWRYWCPLSTAQEDERWKTYLKTSVLTRGSSSST